MPKSKKSRRKAPRSRNTPQPLRIVGIGASAGGLEAMSQLLTHLPPDTGMGFVLVQHLEPTHASMAADIFAKKTAMPVTEVRDHMRIEPNRIYVIPPNRALTIQKGTLRLRARGTGDGTHFPIDGFFKSLAAEAEMRAVGVVLSGTGSDGTKGLEAIQLEGGATIVQSPDSAKYAGMPQAAIAAGAADTVLAPEKIARELVKISRRPPAAFRRASKQARMANTLSGHDELSRIFATLGVKMQMDFSHYRKSTLKRRLARRLAMTKKRSLKEYGEFLASNPEEAKLLAADFLINVTEFFRDPKAFQALVRKAFPKILKRKERNKPIRVWIPGCATGEEAYSVAMALLESLDQRAGPAPIQVFATDLSDAAVQKARAGVYPESISANVSPQRLKRFFSKTEQGYKVQKFLRDLVLFSVHDLTRDPPFARVDLVCCRNLLIYFEPSLQKRALQVIHYALNPGGYLWLGRSESVGTLSTHFSVVDKEKKIFLRKPVHTGVQFATPLRSLVPERRQISHPLSMRNSVERDVRRDAEHLLLSTYGPPGVLVNGEMNIVFGFGETAPFLKLSPGEASLNLFKMAAPTLASDLRIAIQQAKKSKAPVRKENLSIGDRQKREFSVLVIPLKPDRTYKEEFFLVCFEAERKEPAQALETSDHPGAKRSLEITLLKQRLAEATAYQQALIVDFEAAQEELTSTNEEMQSTNEEFQSTNEELETAKEELQSANEELTTVNDELQSRNHDLGLLNNDLTNLLSTVDFAIVMVDRYCNIRRFTPMAGKLMNLIAGDVGRPLSDIKAQFDVDLTALAAEVVESIASKEMEIRDHHGRWYRLQVRPYKTADNHIDGAVVALVDIDVLKRALDESKNALDYATAVADTVPLPLLVLDSGLHFRSANRSFLETFGGLRAAVEKDVFAVFSQPGDTRLKSALGRALKNPKSVEMLEIEVQPPGMRRLNLMICAKRIKWIGEAEDAVLMSIDDVTERKDLLEREKDARQDAERANRIKDEFLATLSHELRTPLNSILSWSQLIQKVKYEPKKLQHGIEIIEQSAKTQGQLIDDLLDVSRIQSGKLALNFVELDPSEVVAAAIESVGLMAESKQIELKLSVESRPGTVWADRGRLQQIVWNLLTNAIKFSPPGGKIRIKMSGSVEDGENWVSIQVEDQGKGIKPDFLPKLFQRFSQSDSSSTRVHGGLGLGLAIVSDLLNLHGGRVRAESEGLGKGSVFTVLLPVKSVTLPSNPVLHAARVKKPTAGSQWPNLKGLRVMIVDDEPGALEVLRETLHALGASTISCSSANEAMASLKKETPDALVCDIAMPGEDGYSLIRRIRALPNDRRSQVPSLALSAYATDEDAKRALASGFEAHMAKPYDTADLGQAVARLVKKREK